MKFFKRNKYVKPSQEQLSRDLKLSHDGLLSKKYLSKKYFTPTEVNQLLPEIRGHMATLHVLSRSIENYEKQIMKAGRIKELIKTKNALNGRMVLYWQTIQNLEMLGCHLKSLETGLIDFPAVINKKEVWLCWKWNESEVSHWHHIHDGFNSRQPINSMKFSKVLKL